MSVDHQFPAWMSGHLHGRCGFELVFGVPLSPNRIDDLVKYWAKLIFWYTGRQVGVPHLESIALYLTDQLEFVLDGCTCGSIGWTSLIAGYSRH